MGVISVDTGAVGVRESDDESFVLAFDRLHARAYRVAFRILGVRADAQDVADESLARAYARWKRLSDDPEPWVVRVASNLSIDATRRRSTADRHLSQVRPAQIQPTDSARHVDLQRALVRLPNRQREVVVLRHLADLSEHQVAKALGISPGTVKSHGARGLAALRKLLGEEDGDV